MLKTDGHKLLEKRLPVVNWHKNLQMALLKDELPIGAGTGNSRRRLLARCLRRRTYALCMPARAVRLALIQAGSAKRNSPNRNII